MLSTSRTAPAKVEKLDLDDGGKARLAAEHPGGAMASCSKLWPAMACCSHSWPIVTCCWLDVAAGV